jgi:hypothetical protein
MKHQNVWYFGCKKQHWQFTTLRSRTPTSTGMRNVWRLERRSAIRLAKRVQDDFHIPLDGLKWLNKYLANMLSILPRGEPGAVHPGNSCRYDDCWISASRQGWIPVPVSSFTLALLCFLFWYCRMSKTVSRIYYHQFKTKRRASCWQYTSITTGVLQPQPQPYHDCILGRHSRYV